MCDDRKVAPWGWGGGGQHRGGVTRGLKIEVMIQNLKVYFHLSYKFLDPELKTLAVSGSRATYIRV